MRAFSYKTFGEPENVLTIVHKERSSPQPVQIRVRMIASAMNWSDLITIRGTYAHRIQLPAVPGYEGVGIVEAVGSTADHHLIGQRVLPLGGEGTWQDYVISPAERVIIVPPSIPDGIAAQLYINPITVWVMLTEILQLKTGDTLVVNAAGSMCGQLAAQFCKILGIKMVAIVRSDVHTEKLLKLGAEKVVQTLQGILADAALDCIGGLEGAALASCVKPGATFVSYGLLSKQPLELDRENLLRRNIHVKYFWLKNWIAKTSSQQQKKVFEKVMNFCANNRLILPAANYFDLAQIKKALQAFQAPGPKGKIIFRCE